MSGPVVPPDTTGTGVASGVEVAAGMAADDEGPAVAVAAGAMVAGATVSGAPEGAADGLAGASVGVAAGFGVGVAAAAFGAS